MGSRQAYDLILRLVPNQTDIEYGIGYPEKLL
jgi:hypothetical protein